MNNKIITPHDTTGLNAYALIFEGDQIWDNVNDVIVAWDDADVLDYDVPMAELGTSKIYSGTFPAAVPPGTYTIIVRTGVPAADDDPIAGISFVRWNGSELAVDAGVMLAQAQGRRS